MTDAVADLRCLNCGAPMAGAQNYCGACGQRVTTGRLHLHDIGHDLVHAITHADHSIFSLTKDLALNPGRVAREYVEGKRKKYFGPFAFLFISVGVASFIVLVLGVRWFSSINETSIAGFLQRHINLIVLIQAPILAALSQLFFRSSKLNFAENLVLAAYTSGFRCVFLAFVGTPLMRLANVQTADRAIVAAYYSLWVMYFAYAAVRFFGGKAWWTACKAAAAAILTQAIAIYLIFAFVWVWMHVAHY